jgi:hypothetical protein
MRNTDYEKQNVTMMVCITADGHKLSLYIILNHRIIPRMILSPKDVMCVHKNWWMTVELIRMSKKHLGNRPWSSA